MNIYIVRHAIAVERGTPGMEEDGLRPLTEEGRKKFAGCVRGLKSLGVSFDLVLSSPYVRARQTAEILAEGLGMKVAGIQFSAALLPMAMPQELVSEMRQRYRVDSLAVVGHEPHLSTLISYLLTGGNEMTTTLKKGGVCLLAVESLDGKAPASLEWLLTPKQLNALAV